MLNKEILKDVLIVLDKYGKLGTKGLIEIAGVKTGRLKSSIKYEINKDNTPTLHFGWIWYGKFINPWKKKSGWTTKPGWRKVLSLAFYSKMNDELAKVIAKDITKEIVTDIKKISK